ncbi:MAG: VOC family protein [Pseudomonadota bacterium]
MSEMHGTVHWTELNTHNIKAAKAYYADVCGWSFDTMPMEGEGEYTVGRLGEQMVAGLFDISAIPEMKDIPSHWLTYLAVDDVDAAVSATKAMGGQVYREPWDISGVGRIAIVADPSGASFGLMTPSD